jgi:ABC-type phosphate/phosphonate transport system substrate-binding protein
MKTGRPIEIRIELNDEQRQKLAGWHQRAIRMVCDGEVDASAIDSQVLAIELRDNPELATQLKIIDVLGPAAIQPVIMARTVQDSLKADVQAALLDMGSGPGQPSPTHPRLRRAVLCSFRRRL